MRLQPLVASLVWMPVGVALSLGCGRSQAPASSSQVQGQTGVSFTVQLFRPESGTVRSVLPTGEPDGRINCGAAVNATACGPVPFEWTATVRLEAVPDAGSMFGTWAGDCAGRSTCVLDTSSYRADKYVVAVFGPVGRTPHTNFAEPTLHGSEYMRWVTRQADAFECAYCHGSTLQGQGIAPGCSSCHAWPRTGKFVATGSMTAVRSAHVATKLPNGTVLVAGGANYPGPALASADIYDPATGAFSATGDMVVGRCKATATLLPNGLVLVAGGTAGANCSGASLASAELYDPATGRFAPTGSLNSPRDGATATLLGNGFVLIAGGNSWDSSGQGQVLASAELYDPATGAFRMTGSMGAWRADFAATLLGSGLVLITGEGTSAELYDPRTGRFSPTGPTTTWRGSLHTATLLLDGRVLVAGGFDGPPVSTAEIYDPVAGTFSATTSMTEARSQHTATLLPDGRVLLAGGYGTASLSSAEIYDPLTDTFTSTPSLTASRVNARAVSLTDGAVLITGGGRSAGPTADLFIP